MLAKGLLWTQQVENNRLPVRALRDFARSSVSVSAIRCPSPRRLILALDRKGKRPYQSDSSNGNDNLQFYVRELRLPDTPYI